MNRCTRKTAAMKNQVMPNPFSLVLTALTFILLFGFSDPSPRPHHAGRCTGSSFCTACSNCSRCQHCSGGGTCGVCAPPVRASRSTSTTTTAPAKQQLYSSQCQATTKKGARCKRAARSNGYCWQHGG